MKRDTLINILLIIAGILMALALFGAGAVWKGRMKPNRPSVSTPAADKDRSLARKKLNSEESLPVVSALWCPSIAVKRWIR